MYPVLIVREEIVCMIILLFLYFMSRSYLIGKDSKPFTRLMWFAMLHVAFDIITVLTVNNMDTVPLWLNNVCHIIFYTTAILFANEIFFYVMRMCYPNTSRKFYWLGYILVGLFMCSVPLLGVQYAEMNGTYSSTGIAAYAGFAVAFLYFLAATVVLFINFGKLNKMVKYALLPMMLVLFASVIVQIAVPEMLFTGGGITIVTVAFFFSVENPVHLFRQKAMTDALTGVQSRQSYDMDIADIDEKFKKNPNSNYIFAFCDINNLKAVNGLFGHTEGDHYITLVTGVFMSEFRHADGIYRMGGDEFFVIFHNVDEETVIEECRRVQEKVASVDTGKSYTPAVAIGYAIAGPEYKSIRDVVRTADYMMYKNKTEMKGAKSFVGSGMGTTLNLTGLTDSLFDAMCSSNERIYPFLCNLETNVTRISPAWNEYFGMGFEFTDDFGEKWGAKIHPDDVQEDRYIYTEVMTGKRKYYNCEYRALNSENEYVLCETHGAKYNGKNGEPDVFAGYLINRGIEEKVDAITGFDNFIVMDEKFLEIVGSDKTAIILKLVINNAERLNMIYGYSGGRDILRDAALIVQREVGELGDVYTDKGINVTIPLYGVSRAEAVQVYDSISEALAHGVEYGDEVVPLNISGGAAEIVSGTSSDRDTVRSELLFALDESRDNKHNKLVFTDEMFEGHSQMDLELLTEIHKDATGDAENFCLRYQPIVDTQTGKVIGSESLLRWKDAAHGEIVPGRFIDFLETDSCFYELGLKILRWAVKDAVVIRKQIPDYFVGVNVTAVQMRSGNFANEIMDILEGENYPPEGLVLELTERSKELDADFLKESIADIRNRGVKVAFDDMGTGYSTVNLLLNIPVDEVKLDKDFVERLQDERNFHIYATALTASSARTGTAVCFEGVETEKMHEFLKQYGESYCQGFYFAKPLLIEEFLEFTKPENDNK
ncbi:MAG: EAL domain-containing protein [Bacillota bacterium]|nr:EAL domain-containing protein [Bacillota bacterium]